MEINLPETENLEISPFERLDSVDRKKLLALHITRSALRPRGFISDWGFPPQRTVAHIRQDFRTNETGKSERFRNTILNYLGHPAFWTQAYSRLSSKRSHERLRYQNVGKQCATSDITTWTQTHMFHV